MAVTAYWPTFRANFVWDDDLHLTKNRNVTQADGLAKIWFEPKTNVQYQPIVFSSFWLEYRLWQLDPRGYHVVNFILHSMVSLVVWRAAHLLKVPGAALIAAVFALHPVHVESVAWITERKNVLSAVLYMLSGLAYMRFCPIEEDRSLETRRWFYYGLALLLFAAALLSKSVTCSLPAVLWLLMWWKRGRVGLRDLALLMPMFAAGVAMAAVTAWMARNQNRAIGEAWDITFAQSLSVAGRSLWFYAGRLLWPSHLTFVYPRWRVDTQSIWPYLFPMSVLALIIVFWLYRRRVGRGPLVALLIFGGSLFPALSFFDFYYMRYSFVADHFQYLASLGVIGLVVGSGSLAAGRYGGVPARLLTISAVIAVVCCAWLTRHQASHYHNTITLWQDTVKKNPDAWLAQINLGNERLEQHRINQAMVHFRQALRARRQLPKAHHGLAVAFHLLGNLEEATSHYMQAVALDRDYAVAYSNWGDALMAQGRVDEAIESYRRTIKIKPDSVLARIKLARVLGTRGELEQAIAQLHAALRHDPTSAEAHFNLAVAYLHQGNRHDAENHLRLALRCKNDMAKAHNYLGILLEGEEAIEHYREAIRIKPNYYEAHGNLGKALADRGEIDQAAYHLREALRIRPDFAPARSALEKLPRRDGTNNHAD